MFAILKLLLSLSIATSASATPIAAAVLREPIQSVRAGYLLRTTGRYSTVLFSQNADAPVPLASITKLMTALTLHDRGLDMEKTVTISADDIKGGAIPYLIPGDEVSVRDLWNLMLIVSSNDAAAALARSTGLSETEFVEVMNAQAKKLGLTHTHFADTSGLNPDNMSTAREIAAMARVAFSIPEINHESELGEYVFTPKDQAPRHAKATNLFSSSISLPGFELLGAKTGHIAESGYNLVVAARGKSGTFIGVIAGAPSVWERFTFMRELLNRTQ